MASRTVGVAFDKLVPDETQVLKPVGACVGVLAYPHREAIHSLDGADTVHVRKAQVAGGCHRYITDLVGQCCLSEVGRFDLRQRLFRFHRAMPRRSNATLRRTDNFPLNPVVSALLDLLERMVDVKSAGRDTVARAALAMCVLNTEAKQLSEGSEALLSYEAARLGFPGLFFRDGLAIDPFGQKDGNEVGFSSRHTDENPTSQFQLDRIETAKLLHGSSDEDVQRFLRRHDAPDLINLRPRLRVFVGRVRHVAQTLAVGGRAVCRVCEREYLPHGMDASDDENPEGEYWRCAGGFPMAHTQLPVCCSFCASVMQSEVDAATGITAEELLDYDAHPHLTGPRRVHVALRAAFKRNELVSRRLRSRPTLKVLSPAEVMEMRRFSATMLNCDLALLLSCEKAIGTTTYRNRLLAPMVMRWRTNRSVFLAPLMRVAQIYDKAVADAPPLSPVCTVLSKPRWLVRIVDAFEYVLNGR